MYEYYDNYLKAAGDADAQGRWARQLTWEVARHAVGEEIVVYPLMEEHMGAEGLKLADQDRADHQASFHLLLSLSRLILGKPDCQAAVVRFGKSASWYRFVRHEDQGYHGSSEAAQ